jgi:hypothetical protein
METLIGIRSPDLCLVAHRSLDVHHLDPDPLLVDVQDDEPVVRIRVQRQRPGLRGPGGLASNGRIDEVNPLFRLEVLHDVLVAEEVQLGAVSKDRQQGLLQFGGVSVRAVGVDAMMAIDPFQRAVLRPSSCSSHCACVSDHAWVATTKNCTGPAT